MTHLTSQIVAFFFYFSIIGEGRAAVFNAYCFDLETATIMASKGYSVTPTPSIHAMTSMDRLKDLNTIFGGGSIVSETLTNMAHFLFYRNLREILFEETEVRLTGAESNFVKTLEFHVVTDGKERRLAITSAAQKSRLRAQKVMTEYLSKPEGKVPELEIAYSNDEARDEIIKIWFQGSRVLERFSPAELTDVIIPIIHSKFDNVDAFSKWLFDGYRLGLGHSKSAATYAAKIASSKNDVISFFSFRDVFENVDTAFDLRKDLDPILKGAKTEDLEQFFINARNIYLGKTNSNILAGYASRMQKPEEQVESTIRHYVSSLNLLDYIPPEWIESKREIREQFESLNGEGMIIYLDIKNLGARNYYEVHKQLPRLRFITQGIRHLAYKRELSHKIEEIDAIELKMSEELKKFEDIRQVILKPSDDFLKSTVRSIDTTLQSMAVGQNYRIWSSGDDVFIKMVRLNNTPPDEFLKDFTSRASLAGKVRIGFMRTSNTDVVTLANARMQVAQLSNVLKKLEEEPDNVPGTFALEFVGDNNYQRLSLR